MWLLALSLLAADSSRVFTLPLSPTESLHVESTGEGEPVVLLPGLFGSAFGFRRLVPLLVEAGYRAVVVEPLGIGLSARPANADYSLLAQSDRVAAALDSLGLKHAVLIGHSMGGAMAFRVAYRHPDLVRGFISLEGGPTEQATTPAFRRAMRFVPWIKVFGGIRLIRRKIRSSLIFSSGDPGWVTDSVVQGYTAGAARDLNATLKSFLAMARSKEHEPLRPHLGEVRCPVRLVLGTAPQHDGSVGSDEVDLLARTLPNFAVDSADGAGHFIQEEQPERVMVALDELEHTLREAGGRGSAPGSR